VGLDYDSKLLESLRRVYGDSLGEFLASLAQPGRRLYVRVNTLRVEPAELVRRLAGRGLEVGLDEDLPEAMYFAVEGPFEVRLRGRVVVAAKEAAESVALGANLYAPGVLKCPEGAEVGDEVTVVTRGGLPVAEGVLVADCYEALRRRRGVVVEVYRSLYRAPRVRELPEFAEGLVYPQSLPAMYVPRILDPRPREVVVDMCAAPGGKTGHVVELTKGRSYVLAFDHSKSKVARMREELSRLGHLPYVETWVADSRYLHEDFPWVRADRVLVDPPCTALGVRPKLEDRKSYRDVEVLKRYQLQFLRAAAAVVKPGGTVVYSTCTITSEENEEVVEEFLEEFRCFEVAEVNVPRASKGVTGAYWGRYARFHPHVHDLPGYFIAKLVRTC